MRPYEVDLLEVVPAGAKPSLGRSFSIEAAQTAFSESTRELRVAVHAQPAQAEQAGNHNLGRFRLSATSDISPAMPLRYQPGTITITGNLPPTKTGGLLILQGGIQDDAPRALVGGKSVRLTPVWAPISNWPSPWQAWRAEIGPSNTSRPTEIQMQRMQIQAGTTFKARWLPK